MTHQPPPVPDEPNPLPPDPPPLPADVPPPPEQQDALAVVVNFWQLPFAQNVLPMLTSLLLHVGLIIIAILTVKAVQAVVPTVVREQIIIPDAEIVAQGPPGGIPHPGLGTDPTRDPMQDQFPDVPINSDGLANKPNLTALPDMMGGPGENEGPMLIGVGPGLIGSGGTGTGLGSGSTGGQLAPFGPVGGGGGVGPKSSFLGVGGNARKIIYICDASGSMMSLFDFLRVEFNNSIAKLQPIQSFNVIFFSRDKCFALDPKRMLLANPANKQRATDFVATAETTGTSNPIPALEMAFNQMPELIYFMTDGDFSDNNAVVRLCQQKTADGTIKINTIAFVARSALDRADTLSYVQMLKQIARDSGGRFKLICPEEL